MPPGVRRKAACPEGSRCQGAELSVRIDPNRQLKFIQYRTGQGKVKFKSFSGSDLLTCMLPTFGPPTIWAISLEFTGNPPF